MSVNNNGNVFIFGDTPFIPPPTTSDAFDCNGNDLYFCAFDSAGTSLLYATYLGGSGKDYPGGIAVDDNGNVYLSGHTFSEDFPTTEGAYDQKYNGGDAFFCKFSFSDLTSVSVTDTPQTFSLNPARPNPFNPSTSLSFTLPAARKAELSIFSVTGQKVRTLVSGPLAAGPHSVAWDGRDDAGKAVSSGVYLSRLTAGKMTATGKMVLMK
jgi:hypothetical protein